MKVGIGLVTIKDVARVAGVSYASVSNVLNGRQVRPETQERVTAAMRQLDFHANAAAQSLKTQRTRIIGLLVPAIDHSYHGALARGIEDELWHRGYNLVTCSSDRDAVRTAEQIRQMVQKRVDAFILSRSLLETDVLRSMVERYVVTLIGLRDPDLSRLTNVVNLDTYGGSRAATWHLLQLGHRRIAFIEGASLGDSDTRLQGYRDMLTEMGHTPDPALVRQGDYLYASGYAAARSLLSLPAPPTAILAANDAMALGALYAANELGIAVPQQLSLVGFDDMPAAGFVYPGLTTVQLPVREHGTQAARLTLQALKNRTAPGYQPQFITLPTTLVVRGTTAAAPP